MDVPDTVHKTQVIIIGAGPTGLSLAAQFLRYEVDFILLEKKTATTQLSKALVVQARTLEIFRELGLAEKAIGEGRITTAFNLFYKGKRRATLDINGLGDGLSAFPYALSLEQSKTEKLLADHLAAQGKQVQWRSELDHFEQNSRGVTVYYKDGNGEERKVEAAYLVGCDGAGSQVRHQLELPFEGSTEPKLFYVADVALKSPVIHRDELYMFMIPKGFVLFFPMEGEGHYRVVGILPGAGQAEEQFEFKDIEPQIRNSIGTPVAFEKLHWFSTYRVHSRKARRFMRGRCFIAGDAAHIHTPAGGQGMNTGIQDGYNLAWKLAGALKEQVNAAVLESYNVERTENARNLLQSTDRMFDIMSGINRFWNFLRLHFFPYILGPVTRIPWLKRRIFPLISQTGISYPHSYLTVESAVGKVKAGNRMPYFVFSDGRDIFSYLEEPAFKLLYFGNGEGREAWGGAGIRLVRHSFREIPEKLFGGEVCFYVLLRPDNHISYIGKDISACRELINRIRS